MSTKDMFSGESGGSVQAGVGIFFQQEADGNVYVKTIVSGGSAERDGTVQVGDVILAVDDREVVGEPLPVLRSLILGQQGSSVKITFQRREGGEVLQFDAKLIRGTAEYFQAQTASRSMEDEIDQLRLQLRQALAHCSQDRDELDRLRKLLQQERDGSARREREIESLQTTSGDEMQKLNETLRKAEQGRREAEAKLHPLQQREADLTEELNRQKEKERLRKEYIEELKKRHEDEKNRLEQLYLKEQAGRRDDQVARLSAEGMLSKVQAELVRLRDFEQMRREREEQYRERFEKEQERVAEAVRTEETLRNLVKDVDQRMNRWYHEYFGSQPYAPPAEEPAPEAEDQFFLA
eukprot:CAMPEP_0196724054 /NCGR_PEP_ID=MMETSP1091-20130531/6069_1 /TAXON_ID=302021 /ORGANISM="Rhodomonas sp., Strain CCMP768" /LENGTH=350 /DNA_ID=CAMNT_0042066139 /DNA_START=52 /DNA_END=1104 /DNA_ORIENTATION=+